MGTLLDDLDDSDQFCLKSIAAKKFQDLTADAMDTVKCGDIEESLTLKSTTRVDHGSVTASVTVRYKPDEEL